MNSKQSRLQPDLTAARYLEALERDDFDAMAELWQLALGDPDLVAAIEQIHAGIVEERARSTTEILTTAVQEHLPSAEIIKPAVGAVSVADVADELFRHTPDRLSAEAHALNERLRTAREPLPDDLGLTSLTAWAEARFGPGPAEYWRAFRQAAVKLELRRGAETDYRLAARRAPKPEDKK